MERTPVEGEHASQEEEPPTRSAMETEEAILHGREKHEQRQHHGSVVCASNHQLHGFHHVESISAGCHGYDAITSLFQ